MSVSPNYILSGAQQGVANPQPNSTAAQSNGINSSVGSPHPVIKAITPGEGWITGGTSVVIIGEGFADGIQVIFGNSIVYAEVSEY